MKIQLQGQSLRVRLSEADVETLLTVGHCDDVTTIAGLGHWRRRLWLGESAQLLLSATDDLWQLVVSKKDFTEFVATRPRRDGLQIELAGEGESEALEISIEVDLRDARRRRAD